MDYVNFLISISKITCIISSVSFILIIASMIFQISSKKEYDFIYFLVKLLICVCFISGLILILCACGLISVGIAKYIVYNRGI